MHNVLMNKDGFIADSTMLSSIAPTGNLSIIVLIKDKQYPKAITSYGINGLFMDVDHRNYRQ